MSTLLKVFGWLTAIAVSCIVLVIVGAFLLDVVVRELLEIMPWK